MRDSSGTPERENGASSPPREDALLPALRPLEIVPLVHQGRRLLLLRDPSGIVAEPLVVSPASLELLRFFDGRHSLREAQLAIARSSGQILPAAQIEAFQAKLESQHYLDSRNYQEFRAKLAREYHAWALRPPQFAGSAYPQDPDRLRETLSALYQPPGGPGLPGARVAAPPLGIAAPHIDFARGGAVYAHAYAKLWRADATRVLILGVSHAGARQPFVATRKDYSTPLGPLPTDTAFLDALRSRLPWELLEEEELHRWEHSIEFQTVFLQHALASESTRILPLLCAFSWEDLRAGSAERAAIDAFLAALSRAMKESNERWLVVAGVDLAHMGPRFGDREALSAGMLVQIHRRDRALLERLAAGDREDFVADILAGENERRICGVPALYALSFLMEGARGSVLAYDQSVEAATGSVVSFGALAFPA
ncbi:MAG: AmmeMemoRadiSam system protein B [Candidatus Eisenbacteria bacterium]|nr:AmmeMemoRadiSam system protein B [Candidatus Eisenbacteria bacterium]